MKIPAAVLVATILVASGPLSAEGSPAPVLAELGALVPEHHALQGFAGNASWYRYSPPPEVRYVKPDFDSWAVTLEETATEPGATRFVAIWRDTGGRIRHVLARGDQVRLFSIDGDTIEFEDPGFLTQVGVARWGWFYDEGLLRTHRTWRFALGPVDETGRPSGPPAPTALYSVVTYEYRRGEAVPFHSRTYWSEEDRQAGRWGQKTWYEADGRHKKTKHNKERPYPH